MVQISDKKRFQLLVSGLRLLALININRKPKTGNYFPTNCAIAYSRFILAIFSNEIPLGHSASQA